MKLLDTWLSKSKYKDDSATEFRDDLRQEVLSMREELRLARKELIESNAREDKWQRKYYELLVKKNHLP